MPIWNWQIQQQRERRHRALLEEVAKIAGVEIAEEADDVVGRKRDQEEEPMTKLEKILKGETRPTRERFADAVRQEAVRIGKSEAAMWEDPLLHAYYEDLPKATAVPVRLHKAACDATELLQRQFERVRKSDPGLSTNEAYDKALSQLERRVRDQYFTDARRALNPLDEGQIKKARTRDDQADDTDDDGQDGDDNDDDEDLGQDGDPTRHDHTIQDRAKGRYSRKRKASDADGHERVLGKAADDECPNCGEDVEDDDNFCSACGAKLKAAKRRATA